MTNPTAVAVRSNHSKEVADGDDAKPTPVPLGELVSLGFAADRRPKPISWARVPKKRRYAKRTEKRQPSQTAAAQYKREQRARWIAQGIVRPRSPEEYALLEAANRMDRLPTMQKVGDGPLAMWVAA